MPDKRGKKFTDAQVEQARRIADAARRQGIDEADIPDMVAIAFAESSGNPSKINRDAKTRDLSYGAWQINMYDRLGPARQKQFKLNQYEDLLDLDTNARAAAHILRKEGGKRAWSTYKKGLHKDWMPSAADIAPPSVRQGAAMNPPRRQPTMGPADPRPVPSPRPTPTPAPSQPSMTQGLTQGLFTLVDRAKGLWPF